MKVLITGGAGFLGLHLAHRFSKMGWSVTLLDIADVELSEYPERISFIKADVKDLQMVKNSVEGKDLIIHAAAGLPLWKAKDIISINLQGTQNVLEAAFEKGIKRVVFVSSTAVYGIPEKHPIEENDPLVGVGPYGDSKIAAEKVCLEYAKKGLCVPIIRPKTFVGTGRLGVFEILFDWVYEGRKIPVIGNGNNRYQLLEVEDLVDAIYLLSTGEADLVSDVYNVGAEKFGTVKEDVNTLCDYAGKGASVMGTSVWFVKLCLRIFEILGISPLYKWVYATADKDSFVSSEKIKRKLGWQPKFSNTDALIKSYQWYLENREGLKGKTGVTHRVAWKQGILAFLKKFL